MTYRPMTYDALAIDAAARYQLQPEWVLALVVVESSGNPWAWNPEPRYRYYWDARTGQPFRRPTDTEVLSECPPADFHCALGDPDQEWWAQSASWGLMQLMGAVAREHGFRGPYLTQLCDPGTNLEYGCRHLASLMTWAGGDIERALAAYNGGREGNATRPLRNAAYVARVRAARQQL